VASANVELVRSIFAAFEHGDFTAADWAHPEIEWVMADGPSPAESTGVDGMSLSFREYLSTWDEYREVVEEFRELDDERVLVLSKLGGRGKTSGLELGKMGAKTAHVYHLRDGKVTRIVNYIDRERAFADLAISSEGDSPGL
jgi:ketosteroid isomerase-like protein